MSTQKQKFELFARLQALGFTYEEAASLRRIEMTLQRWGERECNGEVQRDEKTGKPFGVCGYRAQGTHHKWPVADREAGALRRLAKIVADCNARNDGNPLTEVFAYHQGDCRGCNLYLVTREQLTEKYGPDAGRLLPIDQYYTRGLAVCC